MYVCLSQCQVNNTQAPGMNWRIKLQSGRRPKWELMPAAAVKWWGNDRGNLPRYVCTARLQGSRQASGVTSSGIIVGKLGPPGVAAPAQFMEDKSSRSTTLQPRMPNFTISIRWS